MKRNLVILIGQTKSQGYSLLELVIVLIVVAILVIIAYPYYQQYVIKTKRVQMMAELQNIATHIRAQKIIEGTYDNFTVASIFASRVSTAPVQNPTGYSQSGIFYPYEGEALYFLTIAPLTVEGKNIKSSQWMLKAEPVAHSQISLEGYLSLNHQGLKCHLNKCSYDEGWRH